VACNSLRTESTLSVFMSEESGGQRLPCVSNALLADISLKMPGRWEYYDTATDKRGHGMILTGNRDAGPSI